MRNAATAQRRTLGKVEEFRGIQECFTTLFPHETAVTETLIINLKKQKLRMQTSTATMENSVEMP